eukprot:1152620-Pelagomonas_calceolata.AAC.1
MQREVTIDTTLPNLSGPAGAFRAQFVMQSGERCPHVREAVREKESTEYERHHMNEFCTIRWLGDGLGFFCPRQNCGRSSFPIATI